MAAVGLLTWVLIGKFLDHLPLYRLEQIAARDHVILSRSTLADWVGRLGVALQPLADRLAWHLLQRDCLHADETPVPHDCTDAGGRATQEQLPSSILAMVKPRKPIYGLTAATTCKRGQRSSSSTIGPVAVAGMRSSFCKTGKVT